MFPLWAGQSLVIAPFPSSSTDAGAVKMAIKNDGSC